MPRGDADLPFRPVVTDEEVEEALVGLANTTDAIAAARGRAVKAEHMLKHVRALAFMQAAGSAQARDAAALASPQYVAAVEEYAAAVVEFERLKAQRENHALVVNAWQTASANLRAGRVT